MCVLRQFMKILHDRVDEAPPSRLVKHDRSMDPRRLPRSPHVQQTSRLHPGQIVSSALCSSNRPNHSGGAPRHKRTCCCVGKVT